MNFRPDPMELAGRTAAAIKEYLQMRREEVMMDSSARPNDRLREFAHISDGNRLRLLWNNRRKKEGRRQKVSQRKL